VEAYAGFLKGGSLTPCSISHLQLSLLEHALPSNVVEARAFCGPEKFENTVASIAPDTDGEENEYEQSREAYIKNLH
jgi:hypothetical protein